MAYSNDVWQNDEWRVTSAAYTAYIVHRGELATVHLVSELPNHNPLSALRTTTQIFITYIDVAEGTAGTQRQEHAILSDLLLAVPLFAPDD